jgi:hypothetical protein
LLRTINPRRRLAAYIAAVAAVLGAGVATAPTENTTVTTVEPVPLWKFRHQRAYIRERAHAIKVNGCRAHDGLHFKRWSIDIPAWRREANIAMWKRRREYAKSRSSACLSAMLWNWYETSGARCIREHEGSWTDPGAPYYGGFQADLSFQKTYGGEYLSRYGTANNWPAVDQIHMAHRGHAARGWAPWPTTRVICGL